MSATTDESRASPLAGDSLQGSPGPRAPRLKLSLEDFELKTTLGEGSVSQVVLAKLRTSGKEYAIKVLDKQFLLRHKLAESVRVERALLDSFDFEGIVSLKFTFQDEHSLYLGLEYCPNGELFDQISLKERLPVAQARFYAAEIVQMLQYLRTKQVIHRDLKPENLLLTATGHLQLADFGSAYEADRPHDEEPCSPDARHRGTKLAGTADYIAPEALRNEDPTYSADLWALGCIVFHMLTGNPPFRDKSEYLTMERVSEASYDFPPYFPEDARSLVAALLMPDPEQRLGSEGTGGLEALCSHPFFAGTHWDSLRSSEAPEVLQPPRREAEDFNWELSSLVNALPSYILPAGVCISSPEPPDHSPPA